MAVNSRISLITECRYFLTSAARGYKEQLFPTAAAARAEVLQRDPTIEHAIGRLGDVFLVESGEKGQVTLPSPYDFYLHTHPSDFALPSFTDMCLFVGQAARRPSYETMIVATGAAVPGLSRLRSLGGHRFHLTYADGAVPATDPTTPQFFGPTREFEVTIAHDPMCDHHELIVTTLLTAVPLIYRFTALGAMLSQRSEQWFWGRILAGDSPETINTTVQYN